MARLEPFRIEFEPVQDRLDIVAPLADAGVDHLVRRFRSFGVLGALAFAPDSVISDDRQGLAQEMEILDEGQGQTEERLFGLAEGRGDDNDRDRLVVQGKRGVQEADDLLAPGRFDMEDIRGAVNHRVQVGGPPHFERLVLLRPAVLEGTRFGHQRARRLDIQPPDPELDTVPDPPRFGAVEPDDVPDFPDFVADETFAVEDLDRFKRRSRQERDAVRLGDETGPTLGDIRDPAVNLLVKRLGNLNFEAKVSLGALPLDRPLLGIEHDPGEKALHGRAVPPDPPDLRFEIVRGVAGLEGDEHGIGGLELDVQFLARQDAGLSRLQVGEMERRRRPGLGRDRDDLDPGTQGDHQEGLDPVIILEGDHVIGFEERIPFLQILEIPE